MYTVSEGKSAAMAVPATSDMRLSKRPRRSLRRYPSLFFMPALLIVSLAITVAIHPQFSDFDLQSLAMGALPLAFAAAAQTMVVISGGIDLSIGSVMAVTHVLSASRMGKTGFRACFPLRAGGAVVRRACGARSRPRVVAVRFASAVATPPA